ncbi:MAG: 6-phosphofructokinase, partial [Deltaproteobacteria bacterium]|nr:6-phosphofructokinase [Deltaproteobacteria bacterium]
MKVGVLTSGGDAPGMNAALWTIAKMGAGRGVPIVGILRGYEGLLRGETRPLGLTDVDGISRFGGTLLGSARSAEFATAEGRKRAAEQIRALGLDALIVIGGNGSLTGAHLLAKETPCRIVGIPASIDNDVGHCGMAIGVDTAVNTIVEACDRISDTAQAHHRAFIVEVMGRRCGYLAMRSGLASEADAILYAERDIGEDELVAKLRDVIRRAFAPERGKRRVLIVKAEGVKVPTHVLRQRLQKHLDE